MRRRRRAAHATNEARARPARGGQDDRRPAAEPPQGRRIPLRAARSVGARLSGGAADDLLLRARGAGAVAPTVPRPGGVLRGRPAVTFEAARGRAGAGGRRDRAGAGAAGVPRRGGSRADGAVAAAARRLSAAQNDDSERRTQMTEAFREFDHVGIAVDDLDAAVERYRKVLGADPVHREVVEHQGVEEVLFDVGGSYVQLLGHRGPDTPVGKFLASRGPGIHHIAYRVDDVDAALETLRGAGARLVDESGRPGSRGTTVAFVHPSTLGGVLVELVQEGA